MAAGEELFINYGYNVYAGTAPWYVDLLERTLKTEGKEGLVASQLAKLGGDVEAVLERIRLFKLGKLALEEPKEEEDEQDKESGGDQRTKPKVEL